MKCWWGCGEMGLVIHWWWNIKWYIQSGKHFEMFFINKTWKYHMIWQLHSLAYNPEKWKTYAQKFMAALFRVFQICNQPRGLSMGRVKLQYHKSCVHACVHAQLLSCVRLFWDPMDCSRPGSSVHGISQARKLGWVAISSSRGSSQPRDRTHISCIADRFLITEPPGKQHHKSYSAIKGNFSCYMQQPGWISSKAYKLCDFIYITFLKGQDDQNGKQTNNREELRKNQVQESRRHGYEKSNKSPSWWWEVLSWLCQCWCPGCDIAL